MPERQAQDYGDLWARARSVRELEAVLKQAMIFKGEGLLGPGDQGLSSRSGAIVGDHSRGSATLTGCQEEALRIAADRQSERRGDLMARCGSQERRSGGSY